MKLLTIALLAQVITFVSCAQDKFATDTVKNDILFMREEEKLARDVYDSMYQQWGLMPFGNIRYSEQMHMDRMKTLVDRYGLADPVAQTGDKPGVFMNATLAALYNELITAAASSSLEALRAGAKIEEVDILDLVNRSKNTSDAAVLTIYENLRLASEQHLRAFVRNINASGVTYVPVVLSPEQYNAIINSSR